MICAKKNRLCVVKIVLCIWIKSKKNTIISTIIENLLKKKIKIKNQQLRMIMFISMMLLMQY